MTAKASAGKAQELVTRDQIEDERLKINQKAIDSQLAVQQAKVDQMRALADLKQQQLGRLKVQAGVDGVLVDMPLQVGQHVLPGAELAKIVQPNHLMAELKIPETQARDVQIGEPASVDTHNGVIAGEVSRVDPAVQNGTVTVDVKLTGELPKGARPDLSVDGTIDLEKLENVLYVGRPAFGQENSTISMFRLDPAEQRRRASTGEDRTRLGEPDPDRFRVEGRRHRDSFGHVALGQHRSSEAGVVVVNKFMRCGDNRMEEL